MNGISWVSSMTSREMSLIVIISGVITSPTSDCSVSLIHWISRILRGSCRSSPFQPQSLQMLISLRALLLLRPPPSRAQRASLSLQRWIEYLFCSSFSWKNMTVPENMTAPGKLCGSGELGMPLPNFACSRSDDPYFGLKWMAGHTQRLLSQIWGYNFEPAGLYVTWDRT